MHDETNLPYLISQGFSETIIERFWKKVNKNGPIPKHCPELGPCWVWTGGKSVGYGSINTGFQRSITTNRLSWMIHFGPIPDGLCALHRCDNRACVRPDHLFIGTYLDNMRDMIAKGRQVVGSRKLNEQQVAEIKRLIGTMPRRKIAELFGVKPHCISDIFVGKFWSHVSPSTLATCPLPPQNSAE